MPVYILAADIGGTNSRFGIFASEKQEPIFQISLKTAEYANFIDLLRDLKKSQTAISFEQVAAAVFAVAGPIVDMQKINPPNIKWNIVLSEVLNVLGLKHASLINDFQAQALAVIDVGVRNKLEILKGKLNQTHPKAVIGAGTGFGKSLLIKTDSGQYRSFASEGGHTDFSPTDDYEYDFTKFIIKTRNINQLTWDDVLSGRGLEALHHFVANETLSAAEISSLYLDKESKTLEMFAKFYGRAARNFVLDTMALGGLFIAGGVAAKNPFVVQSSYFKDSFLDSIYREMLSEVSVSLLASEDSGLRGAAYEAFRLSGCN